MKATGNNYYAKESDFQSEAIEYIKSRGGYVPQKEHQTSFGASGTPDLVCCFKGYYISFELKIKKEGYNNKPSLKQQIKIKEIIHAGGIAKAVWNLKEIGETLDEVCRIQQGGKS